MVKKKKILLININVAIYEKIVKEKVYGNLFSEIREIDVFIPTVIFFKKPLLKSNKKLSMLSKETPIFAGWIKHVRISDI